ncbi:MAG: hypothetical protein JRI68_18665 [Deltaproteobacteria bacterium]|nr:hypothetical protein [Deltaproteobacteria bacterium]
MSTDAAHDSAQRRWKPHPDDEDDLREALSAADRDDLLSPVASESFLQWLEGGGDDWWRDELE